MKAETIRQSVFNSLNDNPSTRKDDYVLLADVIRKQENRYLSDTEKQAIIDILLNWRKYELPNFSTVIRERRYLQIQFPYLIDKNIRAVRLEEEQRYHDTYKSD